MTNLASSTLESSVSPSTGEILPPTLEELLTLGPTSVEFAEKLRDVIFDFSQRQALEKALSQHPELDLSDPSAVRRITARALYNALELAAELPEGVDNVLRATVVHATDQQLHRYHDEEYDTALGMVEAALEGKDRSGSEFIELRTLVNVVIPYMRANNLPYVEHICAKGAKSKSRTLGAYLNGIITNPAIPDEVKNAKVQEALGDLADKNVSVREMDKKYRKREPASDTPPPPPIPPITAWNYVEQDGEGYLLLAYNRAQWQLLQAVLQGVTDIRLGTGKENVLEKLRRRKLEVEEA